jgi:hypothetical protein
MSNVVWVAPWTFPLPSQSDMATYMLAYDVRSNIIGASTNFLAAKPDPNFANPQAYLEAILTRAFEIANAPYYARYIPAGWNPASTAFALWNQAIAFLKTVAVNASDPDSVSVYDAWVAGTGQLFGGHQPVPVVGITSDGVNSATSAGPVAPGAPVSIFGVQQK